MFYMYIMHKMQTHEDEISKLLNCFASVRAIIHSLKLVDYLPVQKRVDYRPYIRTSNQ